MIALSKDKTDYAARSSVCVCIHNIPILLLKLLTAFFSTRITIVVHEIFRPPQESKTASFFNSPPLSMKQAASLLTWDRRPWSLIKLYVNLLANVSISRSCMMLKLY